MPITAELYRTLSDATPPVPEEVIQLHDETQLLDDAAQVEWAKSTMARNLGDFKAKAERAAPVGGVTPVAPDLGTLRTRLADAIGAHAQAGETATSADAAVAHAAEAMTAADVALGEFADLDAAISRFTIDSLAARRPTTLPPEMQTAQQARSEAVQTCHRLHLAHGQLLAEAQAARVAVQAAEATRNEACARIIAATADTVATQLREVDQHAAELRNLLISIGDTWLTLGGGVSRSVGLSSLARTVLLADRPQPQLDRTQMVTLRDWYVRLQTNPNSEFP